MMSRSQRLQTGRNPWVGASFGETALKQARTLARAHELALGEGRMRDVGVVRPVVKASWERSRTAGIDPSTPRVAPVSVADAGDRWSEHPLRRYADVIERTLSAFAYDAGHIVVVADADGCLLWSTGHPKVLSASESICFTPGHLWAEPAVGTNGIGTALAVDHPVQIFASEHFLRTAHAWVCSGAPVHDPSGRTLGVIDVSSGVRASHPYALALVCAAASTVELLMAKEHELALARLRSSFFERVARMARGAYALIDNRGRVLASHPDSWLSGPLLELADGGWVAPGSNVVLRGEPFEAGTQIVSNDANGCDQPPPMLTIEALGRDEALVSLQGAQFSLSPRRSELLVLLALAPEGLPARELTRQLFGDDEHRMTLRAEVSRLRRLLGGLIGANPYRLLARVDADFLSGQDGRMPHASGALLPSSRVPAIVAARRRLDGAPGARARRP